MSYCIIGSTITSLACSLCTAPREALNSYCLCPSYLQQDKTTCASISNSQLILVQASQALVLVGFAVQLFMTWVRVNTPLSWRAWTFLQSITSLIYLPTAKDSLTLALLNSAFATKGFYWLDRFYPGTDLKRWINIVLAMAVSSLCWMLAYFLLPKFYKDGFKSYLKFTWNYLFLVIYLLTANEVMVSLSMNILFTSSFTLAAIAPGFGLLIVLVGAVAILKASVNIDDDRAEELTFSSGISKFVNAGWLLNIFLTGAFPLLAVKNNSPYLIFVISIGVSMLAVSISFLTEGFSVRNLIASATQVLLSCWAVVCTLQLLDLGVAVGVAILITVLVMAVESVWMRVQSGRELSRVKSDEFLQDSLEGIKQGNN